MSSDSSLASPPAAGSPGKLHWRDLMRADVSTIHRAMANDAYRETGIVRRASGLFRWLEHHGERRMKVLYCPPLPLLWSFVPDGGSPAARIHKTYLREVWRERGFGSRATLVAEIALLWPLINLAAIGWATWLNGPAIRRRTGKSIARQVIEQLEVSATHAILAPWYYAFDLHDDAKRRQARDYLHRFETKGGLYKLLKKYRAGVRTSIVDKVKFAERCREYGVSTLPVVAVAEAGELRIADEYGGALPEIDLFIKPTRGRGGSGADWWRRNGSGTYFNSTGQTLTNAGLMAHIEKLSLEQPYLVNTRAVNHPEIADLSNGALCTVRILTVKDASGAPEATDAVFRMAVANTVVDNFHAGGIGSNVDMVSGELGPASDIGLRPECGWCDRHPTTGASITGRRLPFWRETIDLVGRGHAAFSDRAVIGWDVAILPDGPCVIECNGSPDLDIHQRCHGAPIGSSRLGELLAVQIERAVAASHAARSPAAAGAT